MGLFDIFKKKNADESTSGPMGGSIGDLLFYHEDDYCMIELTPIENADWLRQELADAHGLSEKNFDGHGWTSMYVKKDHAIKLSSRKINSDRLIEIIKRTNLPQAKFVTTGYGQTARESLPDTIGFGKDYSAIYFKTVAGHVDRIWFTNLFSLDRENLVQVLHDSAIEWNLVLVDWFEHRIVNILDKDATKVYFDHND